MFTSRDLESLETEVYENDRILLRGMSWEEYEQLLVGFQHTRLRISYDRGDVEIMIRFSENELGAHVIDLMIFVLSAALSANVCGMRHLTLRRRDRRSGVDPDQCYWCRHERLMRGKTDYRMESDPAPDLALEASVIRSSLDRIGILESLGVPEVWEWTGERLQVRALGPNGRYRVQEGSVAFPGLRPANLVSFLELALTEGQRVMTNAFSEWARAQMADGSLRFDA
jgi:Uma2 family endonuclease